MMRCPVPNKSKMEEEILKNREIIKPVINVEDLFNKKYSEPTSNTLPPTSNQLIFNCDGFEPEYIPDYKKYLNTGGLEIEYAVQKAIVILKEKEEEDKRKKAETEALISYFSSEKFDRELEKIKSINKMLKVSEEEERRKKEESDMLIKYLSSEKFESKFEEGLSNNKNSLLNKKYYKENI